MNSIDLHDCSIGTVSSREDGSVAFRVITAELRPSEKGTIMDFHGKACRVAIFPHEGEPDNKIEVTTERGEKTPSKRLYGTIFVHWKQSEQEGDFDTFYKRQMERIIEGYKEKNLTPL